MSPHIFLVAGEESGDRLGAALIAAIKRRTKGQVHFSCVGGAHMAAEGVPSLFPLGDLAIIGFAAIPGACQRSCDAFAKRPMPFYPHSLTRLLSSTARNSRTGSQSACGRSCRKFPIVDYVCPSVWAWRPGRARTMRAYVDHVLALLPFEPKVLAELGGPPCTFVGHPLVERIDDLRPKDLEKRLRLANPPLILVLPGSREGEIRRMAPVFGAAIARVIERAGPAEVIVPAVSRLADTVRKAVASWRVPARVVTEAEEKAEAFRSARAALSKSGTSTLELALAGVPMVAAYKVSLIEEVVGRLLLNGPSIILANLVLGENVVPEFLQRDCTPARLADALLPLAVRYPGAPAANAGIRAFGHHHGGRKWQSQRSGSNNRARYREATAR
jgi:lipid-A-disaccharide synthase